MLSQVQHEVKGEGMSMTVKLEERLEREIDLLKDLRRDIRSATAAHSTAAGTMGQPAAAPARIPQMSARYEELRTKALATKHSLAVQREVATGQIQPTDSDARWVVPSAL